MTEPCFEMNVSVPHESRFAETLRLLAVLVAKSAGCSEPSAEAFGRTVENAVEEACERCPKDKRASTDLQVVVRRRAGPVEVDVGGQTLTVAP